MNNDPNVQLQADPGAEVPGRPTFDPGQVKGAEPQADSTTAHGRDWHAPQLTRIEIKRTMASSGGGSDSFASTTNVVPP